MSVTCSSAEEARELLAGLRMLEAEVDGGLEVAELAPAIVAAALEAIGDHALLAQQARDAVGELDLAAGAGRDRAQVMRRSRGVST